MPDAGGFSIAESPDSALARVLESLEGKFISLEEARRLALQNATAVREAEAVLRAARAGLRKSNGDFDPVLTADLLRSGLEQPVSSPFVGSEEERTSISSGLAVRLPTGTQLGATLSTDKIKTNAPFTTLNPQYTAMGSLNLVQPLLSGFGPSASADVRASRRIVEAARAYYEDAVLAISALAENTYWDLYAAERDYAVSTLIRAQAATFLRDTELRASAGLVGPNQVANARVFLAEQEQAVLDREENLDRVSDALTELLGERAGEGSVRYRPVDVPSSEESAENIDSLVAASLRNNRLVIGAERNFEAVKARYSGARWDAFPALDVVGSIGGNALSGTPRTVVFGSDTLTSSVSGSWGHALGSAFEREYPTWSIGLQFRMPLFLRAERGERDRLEAEVDRAEQMLIATRRSVESAVRASHRELDHAQKRLEAAASGVEAAQEQVRIGQIEYRAGRTTAFELVRLAADHASAEQRYSQALVRTAKAASTLKRLSASGMSNE
jgi:outer membrane protein TolC